MAAIALLTADYWIYPLLAPIGGRSGDKGENGLWLRYTWYFGEKTVPQVADLARTLHRRHIRYAFFHVRSIEPDGSLKYRYPEEARKLTAAIHANADDVQPIAWIYAGNVAGHGRVDLRRAAVRRRMVAEAIWLTTVCGFDGVQWDYEICPSGDVAFLKLLEETRAALPAGKLLSVAADCSYPAPFSSPGWSDDYFREVAKRCDQMAVMCYDSGMYMPRLYVWFVQRQAALVPRLARQAGAHCQVLLGLPTYGQGGPSHNPRAENLRLALKAVREARASQAAAGIALFADYTTAPDDWRAYESLWLRLPQPPDRDRQASR